jgi:Flp pilus assembly protein TadG
MLRTSRGVDRRGNVAIIFALSLPVLLGFVGMAVDWGAVHVAQTQARTAADAAALAAATSLDDPGRAVALAQGYAAAVEFHGVSMSVAEGDVEIGVWDGTTFIVTPTSPNAVRVTARATVQMGFMRLFGMDTLEVDATAGAGPEVVATRAPDLVVALDVTGSMDASEIAQERVAAQALLDCIHSRASGDSRMGIVLFTGVDTVRTPMLEVGNDYATLSAAISGVRGCGSTGMPACSGTNQAAGMGGALVMLDTVETPEGVGRAILVESDGEPNADSICVASNYTSAGWRPTLRDLCSTLTTTSTVCTGSGRRRTCVTRTTQRQPTEADYTTWSDAYKASSEAAGTDIYTVYYGSDAAGVDWMQAHVRAGDGFSLVTPTAAAMDDAFEDICQAYVGTAAGLMF